MQIASRDTRDPKLLQLIKVPPFHIIRSFSVSYTCISVAEFLLRIWYFIICVAYSLLQKNSTSENAGIWRADRSDSRCELRAPPFGDRARYFVMFLCYEIYLVREYLFTRTVHQPDAGFRLLGRHLKLRADAQI